MEDKARGSRWRAESFRNVVAAYLAGRGFSVTTRDTTRRYRLSESILEEVADIRGLEHVAVLTRAELRMDLSDAVDSAVRAADLDDKAAGVVIQWRRGRQGEDSYVAMTLGHFATLLALTRTVDA